MVRIVLSKHDNFKDHMELYIEATESYTAKKWLRLLKNNVYNKVPLKKHVSMHGWIMDKTRTLKHIIDELNNTVNEINNFNFAKQAYLTNQSTIKKDFNVSLDLTIDNLLQETFNLDVVNQLHDKFVQLEGAKTLDNLDQVSPYFKIATPEIRWQISKLNNLAHELFHWGAEYNRWKKYKIYSPEIHVHYYDNKDNVFFEEDDNEAFTMRHEFGGVYLGDTTVGKTYWDAFNDDDKHIDNNELEPPKNITADFHIHFGQSTNSEDNKIKETKYWKYLYNRGLRDHEPANIRVGQCLVGKVDWLKTFDNQIQEQIQNTLNEYNNIYAIIVNEHKATYEWVMSQEEIDIQYHA